MLLRKISKACLSSTGSARIWKVNVPSRKITEKMDSIPIFLSDVRDPTVGGKR